MSRKAGADTDSRYEGRTVTIVGGAQAAFSSVFVSSTVGDLKAYRRAVRSALALIPLNCFLSEEVASGYAHSVEKCRRQVAESSGYIGIFGYWYGSIPDESPISITHMEFRWALEKWKHLRDDPPMVVFMPEEPDSAAKKRLEEKARDLIRSNYGDTDEKRKEHDALLSDFHKDVTGNWRWVKRFKDRHHLELVAGIVCSQWKGLTPLAASRGEVEVIEHAAPGRRPTDEELGLLGRKSQLDAAEDVLNVVRGRPDAPAVALLVCGDEDAGQRPLLMQLRKRLRGGGRPPQFGRPHTNPFDAVALAQWVGQMLPAGREVSTVEELAEAVHSGLRQQQLCVIVDQIHLLAGGVVAFRENFWSPLYKRLKELRGQQPTPHRFVVVAADYTGQQELWDEAADAYDPEAEPSDYSRPLALPALKDFTRKQLLNWFGELGVPNSEAADRLSKLADDAITNPRRETDGKPLRVFGRLQGMNLWPEGEER